MGQNSNPYMARWVNLRDSGQPHCSLISLRTLFFKNRSSPVSKWLSQEGNLLCIDQEV